MLQKRPCFVGFSCETTDLALSSYNVSVFAHKKVSVFAYLFIRLLVIISISLDISCYETTMLCNSYTDKDVPSMTLSLEKELYGS